MLCTNLLLLCLGLGHSYQTTRRHISDSVGGHCENLSVGNVVFVSKRNQRYGSRPNADVKVVDQVQFCG